MQQPVGDATDRSRDVEPADLIVIVFDGDVEEGLFNPAARDNCHQPMISLREELRRNGFETIGASGELAPRAARILHWDGTIAVRLLRERRTVRGFLGGVRRRITGGVPAWREYARVPWEDPRVALILLEPPVVSSANYEPQVLGRFRTILTWNDELVDGVKYHKYCLPVPSAPIAPEELVSFEQKKLCVNISGNKFSDHPAELYSARRRSIRHFEQRFPRQFDLLGVGWGTATTHPSASRVDRTLYRSYRGVVESKTETLKHYRFALCYENSDGPPGYVTEKIFDCLRADCVPVYLGAPNIAEYVDEAAYIDRRRFSCDEELAVFLERMEEHEYLAYRNAATRYLKSDRFERFLPPAFISAVLAALRVGEP